MFITTFVYQYPITAIFYEIKALIISSLDLSMIKYKHGIHSAKLEFLFKILADISSTRQIGSSLCQPWFIFSHLSQSEVK